MNTPITDSASQGLVGYPFKDGDHLMVDLARQLERDRARLLEFALAMNISQTPGAKVAERVLASLEIKDDK